MKILFINNIGTLYGGREAMIGQLRRGLRARKHEVRILAGDERGSGKWMADDSFKSFEDGSPLKFLYVLNPFAVIVLWRVLRSYRPDVVHLHGTSKASPFILALLKHYPTILTIHDILVFDPTRIDDVPLLVSYNKSVGGYFIRRPSIRFYLERLRFFFFRRFAKYIDIVLACSDFYCQCGKDSGLFQYAHTLHNGIALLEQKPIEYWENILFVGRLEKFKGVHVLLDALTEIRIKHPNVCVRIAGAGVQGKQLQRRAEELGIYNIVQFIGYQTADQVMKLYQEATLVVIPSIGPETFGLVGIEAMSVGRPVIASRVGGIPEWLDDGKTGFLVDPGNSEQIAEKIIQLLSDRKLLEQMGKNARKKAEQFSIEKHIDKIEKIYEELVRKYKTK